MMRQIAADSYFKPMLADTLQRTQGIRGTGSSFGSPGLQEKQCVTFGSYLLSLARFPFCTCSFQAKASFLSEAHS